MPRLEMRQHDCKGMLITFCGLDGCGKTTMIKKVSEWLESEGKELFLTKQPTDFVRKAKIFRTYQDSPDHDEFDYRSLSLLAASDRVQHCSKVIFPELEAGKIVISDRYFYSCVANLRARGYTSDKWIYDVAKVIIRPDIAFFIDVPVEVAVERVRKREEEKDRYIDMPLQYRLRDEYMELARDNGGFIISSIEPKETTFGKVKEIISKYMEVKYGNK